MLLALFSDAVQCSPTPHLIKSILHSPQRRLFIDMYKNINLTIASFPEPQREIVQQVWYQTHPFFRIFREDLHVKNLDTLPDWTFEYHHYVLKDTEETRKVFDELFPRDRKRKRNQTKPPAKRKYALDWTFAPSFKFSPRRLTDMWSSVLQSDAVDLSFWDISALSSLDSMFRHAHNKRITGLQHWDVSHVKTYKHMFALSRLDLTEASANALDTWDTSAGTCMKGVFMTFSGQVTGLQTWDVSHVHSFEDMFHNACVDLTREKRNSLHMWNMSAASNMEYMFAHFKGKVTGLSAWDVSNVTKFYSMFLNTNLQLKAEHDNSLEHWQCNKAEVMLEMFSRFKGQVEGLQNWNVSNVSNFYRMFEGSSADLTSRCASSLHTWDMSNANYLSNMFESFEGQVTGLSTWDVSNVFCFDKMFKHARIDLTEASNNSLCDWNTQKGERMSEMFMNFRGNVTGLDQWDVTHVEDFEDMFRDCRADLRYLTSWTVDAFATGWRDLFRTCNNPSCVIRHSKNTFDEWYEQFLPFSFPSHSVRLPSEDVILREAFTDGMEVLVHVGNPKCGRAVDAHAWLAFLKASKQDLLPSLKCLGCFCSSCLFSEFRRWTVNLYELSQDEQSQKWFEEERAEKDS